jgi:hypothetical protein
MAVSGTEVIGANNDDIAVVADILLDRSGRVVALLGKKRDKERPR